MFTKIDKYLMVGIVGLLAVAAYNLHVMHQIGFPG